MRTFFIILFSITFLVSKVFAAPALEKEVVPQNWSGFYTGLIIGGQFGHSSDKTGELGYNADNDQWNYHQTGLNAGIDLGYSYPWYRFIVGPEIELGYLGMNGSAPQPESPAFDTVGKNRSDFYTAFRARLGIDWNRYLVFATGGAIGVNHLKQVVDNCDIAPCGGSIVNARKNNFDWGYIVGGGIELLPVNGWSVKLEYLYVNLGNDSFRGVTELGNVYDWTARTSGQIVRGGLHYYY